MVTLLEPGWHEQESYYEVKVEIPHRHLKHQELLAMSWQSEESRRESSVQNLTGSHLSR